MYCFGLRLDLRLSDSECWLWEGHRELSLAHLSYSLNSFKGVHIGGFIGVDIGDYYRGY